MQRGFLVCIAGFAGGIWFRSFFDLGWAFAFFLITLGAVLSACFFVFHRKTDLLKSDFNRSVLCVAGLFLIAAGAGIFRFDHSGDLLRVHALDPYLERAIILEGTVADEPDVRMTHTNLTVETTHLLVGEDRVPLATKIRVVTEQYPEFSYGDGIRLSGNAELPGMSLGGEEGAGRSFNYRAYLAKDGVYYQMFRPRVEKIFSRGGNPVTRALFSLKHTYLTTLARVLPEPHASLAGGIILGAKEALGDEVLNTFRTAGIIHIVVLSGYNVTIIAEAIGRALVFLPRTAGLGISAASIILFALMTGAGATVVRASLMALLVLLARATGRVSEITTALFIAAFFMLLANPKILVFDPSFQLSFLATMGLLFVSPLVTRFFLWLPERWGIRDAASATLATQIFVMPALVYMTGTFSAIAFLANLLVLPLMPVTMFFSFVSGISAFFGPIASAPFSFVATALLGYILKVAEILSLVPFAAVSLRVSFFVVFIVYALLCMILFALTKNKGSG